MKSEGGVGGGVCGVVGRTSIVIKFFISLNWPLNPSHVKSR